MVTFCKKGAKTYLGQCIVIFGDATGGSYFCEEFFMNWIELKVVVGVNSNTIFASGVS